MGLLNRGIHISKSWHLHIEKSLSAELIQNGIGASPDPAKTVPASYTLPLQTVPDPYFKQGRG